MQCLPHYIATVYTLALFVSLLYSAGTCNITIVFSKSYAAELVMDMQFCIEYIKHMHTRLR